ncbi:MAG: nucleoside recognition domain-containing protein [Lachnospiraceae bacterium]|jgi:spore maturation protein B|nr:nucleoside recognition domain-containing protein [Lachnospiraceae bacterium]MDD3617312.1 nucleoside recognition domain-containing protein [Lachnospiraceae bacterium]
MKFLLYISECFIPLILFYILLYGIWNKSNLYKDFVEGAKDGLKTVLSIVPTLIGLMTAVGMLRASGFLDFMAKQVGRVTEPLGFPAPLVPLSLVRMFSSSAATGLVLDIFKEFGTDSFVGITASLMMCCTETVFYTMSVYFLAAKVTKTRWTLPGAILATVTGIITSVVLGRYF